MATDYTTLSTNVGTGDKVAGDTDGTGLWQYVKIAWGVDGTQTPVTAAAPLPVVQTGTLTVELGATDNAVLDDIASDTEAMKTSLAIIDNLVFGAGTEAAAQRVTIATDSTGVLSVDDNGGNLSIDDGGNSITVDYATTGSGTAAGALRVELPTNGTGVLATVGAVTAITNALPAGTNAIGKLAANSGVDIGDVDVTTVGTITPGTAASSLGKAEDGGHADGDVGVMALTVRKNTAVATSGSDSDYQPLITDTNGRLHVIDVNSAAALVLGSGTEATAQRVTIATDSTGVLSVDDNGGNLSIDDGGNSITVDYATTGSGTATGALRVELANNGTGVMGTVGTVTTVSTVTALTGGGVAHDGADSGNPVKVGYRAISANPTAQTANDRSDGFSDLLGYHLVRPYALNQTLWQATVGPITDTTGVSLKAAGAANVRNYITSLLVTNSDATVGTNVIIQDGDGGTTMCEGWATAQGGWSMSFPTPLRGSAATAVFVDVGTTSSETRVSATGFQAID